MSRLCEFPKSRKWFDTPQFLFTWPVDKKPKPTRYTRAQLIPGKGPPVTSFTHRPGLDRNTLGKMKRSTIEYSVYEINITCCMPRTPNMGSLGLARKNFFAQTTANVSQSYVIRKVKPHRNPNKMDNIHTPMTPIWKLPCACS